MFMACDMDGGTSKWEEKGGGEEGVSGGFTKLGWREWGKRVLFTSTKTTFVNPGVHVGAFVFELLKLKGCIF